MNIPYSRTIKSLDTTFQTKNMIKTIDIIGRDPVGYTDFVNIYISTSASGAERDVLIKHELAHIFLQHQWRTELLRREYGKDLNYRLLNIAFDMEIARHIYTEADEKVINGLRSILKGGITSKHCAEYPDCEFAEDYYKELLKNDPGDEMISFDDLSEELKKEVEEQILKPMSQRLKEMEQAIKEDREVKQSKQLQEHVQKACKNIKPSIASVIDNVIGKRHGVKRISSYRRPCRRESQEFFKKGKITTSRPPKLTVYTDRSGSFCPEKTRAATAKIQEVLTKYRGRIESDVYYFSDELMTQDNGGGGGTNYQCVVNHIIETQSELSIIITDDDHCDVNFDASKVGNVLIIPVGATTTQVKKVLNLPTVHEATN